MLEERAIVVTGAASGMGAACATLASQRGAQVLMVDRDAQALEKVASELGAECMVFDVADVEHATTVIDRCVQTYGKIDGLVNAAGIMHTARLLDITPQDYDRIFEVNLRAVFFLQQSAARWMVGAGGGSIVNFSSTAGRLGRPLASHYAAAKAAIINLTRSAAAALAPEGVRVNAVVPGLVETPMIASIREERWRVTDTPPEQVLQHWRMLIPMGRLGEPVEIAEIVAFLLSDASSYVTGEAIGATGGTDGS